MAQAVQVAHLVQALAGILSDLGAPARARLQAPKVRMAKGHIQA